MMPGDLVALVPMLLVGLGAVVVLLQVAVQRSASVGTAIAAGSLVAALLALAVIGPRLAVTPLVAADGQAQFYQAILLICGLGVVLLLHDYLATRDEHVEEAQVLVLLATLGGCLLAGATHLAMVLLGIELLSIPLYGLVAYVRTDPLGVEAATKYLVLAATSTGFLLFGAALIYGATGALGLAELAAAPPDGPLLAVGVALVLVGLGFKLAVVPFHLWTPDVYQGAPAPVTALVATVSKGAVVAVLARWVLVSGLEEEPSFALALSAMAGASMLAGNLLALLQDNVKRMLAYSSIAHLGYLLVAVTAGGAGAAGAAAFYVAAYAITSLGAFGVVSVLSRTGPQAEQLAGYRGLFWRNPWLAAIFTVALLSLAGVPLTAGFLGKLLVLGTGVNGAEWALVLLLVLGSAIGVFYYLRVIATMFAAEPAAEGEPVPTPTRSAAGWAPLAVAAVVMVALGTIPGPVLAMLAW